MLEWCGKIVFQQNSLYLKVFQCQGSTVTTGYLKKQHFLVHQSLALIKPHSSHNIIPVSSILLSISSLFQPKSTQSAIGIMFIAKTVWGLAQGPNCVRMTVLGVELSIHQLVAKRLNRYFITSPIPIIPQKGQFGGLQAKFCR